MATFSRTTFDAAAYLTFRPSYPKWVHDKVLFYHFGGRPTSGAPRAAPATSSSKPSLAIDLGCGPGISTLSLLPHFDKVIGIDPSSKMVDAAVHPTTPNLPSALLPSTKNGEKLGTLEYKQGYSEDLPYIEDQSVDLITAGQAAHWFNYGKFWAETTRILKPGGSVCLYGYPDFFLPDFPSTRALLNKFSLPTGNDSPGRTNSEQANIKVDSIGEFWEQPGRSIINQGLAPVPFPSTFPELASQWDQGSAFKKTFSTQGLTKDQIWESWPQLVSTPLEGSTLPKEVQEEFMKDDTMDKYLSWDLLGSYLRTWSACHTYLDQHPNDKAEHGGKDIVDRFIEQLRQEVKSANGGKDVDELHLRWPLCFVMIKKNST